MQTVEQTARRRKSNAEKFLVLMLGGGVILAALSFLFLSFGAESRSLSDILSAFFAFDEGEFKHVIARDIRLPRLLADIIVGVSLAVAGAVMQGNTKNPMADSGIMGISAGSVFAIVLMMAFLPDASRLERIGYSCLGALAATLLIYGVALLGHTGRSADRMVLSGMAISTLFSSVSSAVILKSGNVNAMMKYTAGSSANTIWLDVGLSAPFFSSVFMALIQEKVEGEYLGRVLGLSGAIMTLASPLGLAASAVFAEKTGLSLWFLIAGVVTLACGGLIVALPSVRSCDAA